MASFVSKPATFNPYIQQLPIDAMVQVGTQKQSMYNQGIQKIQSQIDNVAGLDIMKDSDKQYLQSKMNSLGDNLKLVAAGDFSDFQLANSVGGMVSQVGKDPNIINAVNSTAKIREGYQLMEEDRTSGNYAPNNQRDFMEQVSSYLDNGEVGQTFSGNYSPFVDVNQHLFDIAKEVGIDETIAQQLWETDSKGNIVTDVNGMPKWNPIMAEKHLKGKNPAKILRAFQTALTSADYNQLAIDGKYKYEGLSQEGLVDLISGSYNSNINKIDSRINDLKVALFKETSKNVKDEGKINSISDQIEYFSNQRLQFERGMENDLQLIDRDPSAVRSNLYINNYLGNMASSLSEMTEETTYSVSPQFEVSMRINEFYRNLERDRTKDQQWYADYQLRASNNELAWMKFRSEDQQGNGPDDVLYEPFDIESDKFAIKSAVENDFQMGTQKFNDINKSITLEMYKSSGLVKRGNELASAFDARVNNEMKQEAAARGMSLEDFYAQFASKQIEEWKLSKGGVPLQFQDLVDEQFKLSKDLMVQANKMEAIKNAAMDIAYSQGLNIPTPEDIQKNIYPVDVSINGRNIRVPSNDIVDFIIYNDKSVFSSNEKAKQSDNAYKRLKDKYGIDFDAVYDRLYDSLYEGLPSAASYKGGFVNSPRPNSEFKQAIDYYSKYDFDKLSEIEAQLYIDEGTIPQRQSVPLMKGKVNDQDFRNRLGSIINIYENNLTGTKGVSTQKLIDIALSDGSKMAKVIATPGVSKYTSTKYTLLLQGEGEEAYPLGITEDDYRYLTGREGLRYQGTPSVIQQVQQYGTSALNGSNGVKDAWYDSSQFVGIKGVDYQIVGNYVKNHGNPNELIFEMYKIGKDKEGKQTVSIIQLDKKFPIQLGDGAWNNELDEVPREITPELIQLLENRK